MSGSLFDDIKPHAKNSVVTDTNETEIPARCFPIYQAIIPLQQQ